MRYPICHILLTATLALVSCKRANEPRPAPDDSRASATQPSAAPAAPASEPVIQPAATQPADATITEPQLLRFVAATRRVVAAAKTTGQTIDTTPDGFVALAKLINDVDALKQSLAAGEMQAEEWKAVGARAWAAWSIAQGDYNAEVPLRENEKRLLEARAQLASNEATIKGGMRVMTDQERAERVGAAHDAAVNATDRAEMWAQKAAQLREQLADAAGETGAAAPGRNPPDLAARNDALVNLRGAKADLSQELAAAERNERQAREEAKRHEASALHPEQALDDTEKADLLQHARAAVEKARAEIAKLQEEKIALEARLSEDRRVEAEARSKVSVSDVKLLRKHLVDFNDAWGMTIEGQIK